MPSFCPIPHTLRDQVWLSVGLGLGLGLARYLRSLHCRSIGTTTLYYWPATGKAETIRLLLAETGVPFEEVNFEKPGMPIYAPGGEGMKAARSSEAAASFFEACRAKGGNLTTNTPMLEVNGRCYTQSVAIYKLVAPAVRHRRPGKRAPQPAPCMPLGPGLSLLCGTRETDSADPAPVPRPSFAASTHLPPTPLPPLPLPRLCPQVARRGGLYPTDPEACYMVDTVLMHCEDAFPLCYQVRASSHPDPNPNPNSNPNPDSNPNPTPPPHPPPPNHQPQRPLLPGAQRSALARRAGDGARAQAPGQPRASPRPARRPLVHRRLLPG